MKKIITMILVMLLVTGCTGKKNDDVKPTATPSAQNTSVPQDSNSDSASSNANDDYNEKTLRTDFKEFPQNILDYAKANSMDIKVENRDYYNPNEENATTDYYDYNEAGLENSITIGVILDYTDESNPKLVYHHYENVVGQVVSRGEGDTAGYGMLGHSFVVKYNTDGEVVSFERSEDSLLEVYGDIWEKLG